MRIRTFVLSLVVHLAVIGGVMVARIMATAELPEPPLATTFVMVTPDVPAMPVPPPRRVAAPTPAANPNAAPIVEPDVIRPEVPDQPGDLTLASDLVVGGFGDTVGTVPDLPPPPRPRDEPATPRHVGGDIQQPQKIHHVAPIYPEVARAAHISGIVILEALLAEDGSVHDVRVLRSVPLLDAAAVTAVRQWRFTPTLLNGTPVSVLMTVTVAFNLN